MLHFSLQLTRLAFSLIPSVPPPPPPTYLCPLSPLAWLQLKGKCSSGEVSYLHHKVLGSTMWPGPPSILLLLSLSLLHLCLFATKKISLPLSVSVTSSREADGTSIKEKTPSTKHGTDQKLTTCFTELHCWQCKVPNGTLLYTNELGDEYVWILKILQYNTFLPHDIVTVCRTKNEN